MDFNLHIRLKSPGRYVQPGSSCLLHKIGNQLIRLLWRCGVDEAGSPSFPGIGEQGELADNKHPGTDIQC
ncbi:hypothetical protein ES707_19266 [subsurface metagenome]